VSAGINLSYAGFTIGGSYANEMEGKQACATSSCATTTTFVPIGPGTNTTVVTPGGIATSTEGFAWDVGVSYAFGPWAFGVTYLHGETEGSLADPDQDELNAVSGGVSYALGPGITARGGVMWAEWSPESGDSQSGVAGALGLSFSF
jgi:predicted porin